MKVSVVIPCLNAERWIREALGSVLAQDRDDVEVIAVDDGSTDATSEIIHREFGSVRLVKTDHRGASAARNLGTSLASGELVQYLDADDMLCPGKISIQARSLEASGADVAYGDWRWLMPGNNGFERGAVVSPVLAEPELDLFDAHQWLPTGAYLFRKSIIERIGGWNENLTLTEDERFVLDCAVRGAKFVRAPGVMAFYRRVAGSTGQSDWSLNRRCRYRNAVEIEALWNAGGGLTAPRRSALQRCFGSLARACVDTDQAMYDEVLARLERLNPGYVPAAGPISLRVLSRAIGYRRAENVARWYRRGKRFVWPKR